MASLPPLRRASAERDTLKSEPLIIIPIPQHSQPFSKRAPIWRRLFAGSSLPSIQLLKCTERFSSAPLDNPSEMGYNINTVVLSGVCGDGFVFSGWSAPIKSARHSLRGGRAWKKKNAADLLYQKRNAKLGRESVSKNTTLRTKTKSVNATKGTVQTIRICKCESTRRESKSITLRK